jgi:hypothetical protein
VVNLWKSCGRTFLFTLVIGGLLLLIGGRVFSQVNPQSDLPLQLVCVYGTIVPPKGASQNAPTKIALWNIVNRSASKIEMPYVHVVEADDEGKWWRISKVYGDTISPVSNSNRGASKLCAKCRIRVGGQWQDYFAMLDSKSAPNQWMPIKDGTAVGASAQNIDEVEVTLTYKQDGQLKTSTLTWNAAGK